MQVYLVIVGTSETPVAVFAEEYSAQNYIDHGKHLGDWTADTAYIKPMELTYGQKLWGTP